MAREAVDSAAAAASPSSNPTVQSVALGRPMPSNLTFPARVVCAVPMVSSRIRPLAAGNGRIGPFTCRHHVLTSRSDEDLTLWGIRPPPSRALVVGRVPRGNEASGRPSTSPCASGDVFRRRGGSADAEHCVRWRYCVLSCPASRRPSTSPRPAGRGSARRRAWSCRDVSRIRGTTSAADDGEDRAIAFDHGGDACLRVVQMQPVARGRDVVIEVSSSTNVAPRLIVPPARPRRNVLRVVEGVAVKLQRHQQGERRKPSRPAPRIVRTL